MRLLFRTDGPTTTSRKAAPVAVLAWEAKGNYLATAEGALVHVWDRHGEHVQEVSTGFDTVIVKLDWDKDGNSLAVLQDAQAVVTIWDMQKRLTTRLDTGLKDPSFLMWSRVGPQLVIGTAKGNVLVYNQLTRKKIPVLGKHPKKIHCGAWSKENQLALGSDDCTLTLSNDVGDTLEQTELKHAAKEMVFATQKTSKHDNSTKETHLSINMGGQSLLLYDLTDPENPLELAFQQRYGQIVTHEWFGDGFMMLGFSEGFLVVISTDMAEIGEELFSGRFHQKSLYDIAYSPALKYAAVAGDFGIKLIEMTQFKDLKKEAVPNADLSKTARVTKVQWSPDGHILTAATDDGAVHAFLARMPVAHAAFGTVVAYLSSLREISIIETNETEEDDDDDDSDIFDDRGGGVKEKKKKKKKTMAFAVDMEPAFVAIGRDHVAVGRDNVVMYYRWAWEKKKAGKKVGDQTYSGGSVAAVRLNSKVAAVLTSAGTVTLHDIEGGGRRKIFPTPNGDDEKGTAIALTEHFFIFGTESGNVEFYSLDADDFGAPLAGSELRHHAPIRGLFPNASGARVVVVDAVGAGYVYNAATSDVAAMPAFPEVSKSSGKKSKYASGDDGPSSGGNVPAVMWDCVDKHVILVATNGELHTYAYAATTVKGPAVSKLGPVDISADGEVTMVPKATPIQHGLVPICSAQGTLACHQTSSGGGLAYIQCPQYEHKDNPRATNELAFCQTLALLKLQAAWNYALDLNARAYWLALSHKAMEIIDVDLAVQVYRQLGDAGMVMGLERIACHVENKSLLAGHVVMLFGNYNAAQDLFLASSRPVTALEMRRDLLHWDQALKLAHTLDPAQVPHIQVEYAQQLEFKTDYEQALAIFQQALAAFDRLFLKATSRKKKGDAKDDDDDEEKKRAEDPMYFDDEKRNEPIIIGGNSPLPGDDEFEEWDLLNDGGSLVDHLTPEQRRERAAAMLALKKKTCSAGVARCTLRLGDLRRGISYVKDAQDPKLCTDCAGILEAMSQHTEAAALYELASNYEKAAAIYIKQQDFLKAAHIIDKVTLPKLHAQYAKACEIAGKFDAAVAAYEHANDMDAVVRLYLNQANQPEKAFDIVRETASSDGAQLVARFCQQNGDYKGAIEFLLMAKRSEDAFGLAKAHDQMDAYTAMLGDAATPDDAMSVAQHYEAVHELGKAGRFYAMCGMYSKALKLYIACGERELNQAIDIVGKARSDVLTHTLIDFLMGEPDGVPKDPNYIYRLYVALGNYPQAAKTAVIISRQEQELGNYKNAHAVLAETYLQLANQGVHVPQSLRRAFILVHSYFLVRKWLNKNDHDAAARLLLRVAKNVSKFPAHGAPILTSTVVECQRAGLKKSAYEYATMLMRPEFRKDIDPKFKRKIEGMIRRTKSANPAADDDDDDDDADEAMSPCPISGLMIPRTQLECPTTHEDLPMCVVTGRHMERNDFCVCPNSKMPALFSEYKAYITYEIQHPPTDAAASSGSSIPVGVALDPVGGNPISISMLRLSTPEEIDAFLQGGDPSRNSGDPNDTIPTEEDDPSTVD